ncbi:MAG TPA: hypothetical protein PLI06_09635 [Methanofastidiosum sp.]|nr:hypothetical protein [Methanofastidiosum sp.]HOI77854.1 hypothetical protein [Methanofastidiosum sp.]
MLPIGGKFMEKIYLQVIGIWVLFVFVAIFNGSIRQFLIAPKVSELTAHQISCFTGITMFFIVMYLWLKFTSASYTGHNLIIIGIAFLFSTIAFEFLFGHFVMGHSWAKLLHDYNLFEGRLWSLVLAWTTIGPYVIAKYVLGKI